MAVGEIIGRVIDDLLQDGEAFGLIFGDLAEHLAQFVFILGRVLAQMLDEFFGVIFLRLLSGRVFFLDFGDDFNIEVIVEIFAFMLFDIFFLSFFAVRKGEFFLEVLHVLRGRRALADVHLREMAIGFAPRRDMGGDIDGGSGGGIVVDRLDHDWTSI